MLAFLVVPIIELYLFIQVSASIGFGAALFWIVAVSILGAWLVRREGMGALRRANDRIARGEIPTDELINGMLILVAGALMLTPGFLTDVTGLVLLFPPSRAVVRRALRGRFRPGTVLLGGRFAGAGFPREPDTRGRGGRNRPEPGADIWDAPSWEDPPDQQELG